MKRTNEQRKQMDARKATAKARTGNYYETKVFKPNKKNTYVNYVKPRTSTTLIGKAAEKREDYEDKISRRSSVPGAKRKVMQGVNQNSKRVQFPSDEKLNDGRHRYYVKHGVVVDRKDS